MRNAIVFGVMIITALTVTSLAGQTIVWNQSWDSGFFDMTYGVALDTVNGAVYFVGTSRDGSDMATDNMVTLKYDTDGNYQWAKIFDSDTTDDAFDVAVDASGFIYVAGYSTTASGSRIRLIKYDADSNEIWNVLHESSREEWGYGVTTDPTGNIYVAGPSWGQALMVKFASDGDTVWSNVAQGFSGYPSDLVVAPNGSIYTAGSAQGATNDPLVIRYNSDGDTIWHKLYDQGGEEWINDFAVDADGNLYLTGSSRVDNDSPSDILILKLDADGTLLWNKTYDATNDDVGEGIAVDENYVYITGRSYNETSYVTSLPLICYDKQGNLLWDTLLISHAAGEGIVSDGKHNLYISADEGGNFGLLKVHHSTAVEEQPSSPSSVTLEVLDDFSSSPSLRYSIPDGQSATLSVYSSEGRKIESFTLGGGKSHLSWNTSTLPSGVYFARLDAGGMAKVARFVKIR